MATEQKETGLLHEAIGRFNTTSAELERYYQTLTDQVRQLKRELEASRREKEALREQAERNHRLRAVGEMAGRMAHELRNPLGSIELFASLLRKEVDCNPEKQQWVEHISTAVRAMDYALTNLLLFTGKPRPRFRKTDLGKVIEEAKCFVSHLIEQNHVRFIQSTKGLPGWIWCDEDLLRQVFLNLILNAIEAMPHGGELRLAAETAPDGGIWITIADTGTGIPEEILPSIFDPFFTTKNKGTGLGLSIAHNAILAHSGSIEVQSRAGEGTCFFLRLPLQPRTA